MIVVRQLPNGDEVPVDGKTLSPHTLKRINALFAWHVQHGGMRPKQVVLRADGSVTLRYHAKAAENGEHEHGE